ncbi:exocyst complex component 1-like [Saccostrea cucullata]|uniref:exocyst complex component 1-like n=1 Tax=Saccostrea cuccullata TaxID=36930 RepID=UPI002ED4430C
MDVPFKNTKKVYIKNTHASKTERNQKIKRKFITSESSDTSKVNDDRSDTPSSRKRKKVKTDDKEREDYLPKRTQKNDVKFDDTKIQPFLTANNKRPIRYAAIAGSDHIILSTIIKTQPKIESPPPAPPPPPSDT